MKAENYKDIEDHINRAKMLADLLVSAFTSEAPPADVTVAIAATDIYKHLETIEEFALQALQELKAKDGTGAGTK